MTLRFAAAILALSASAAIAQPATLRMTFDDEFNIFVSSPNGSTGWMTTYPYGGQSARSLPGNGEAEYYSDASVGVNPFSVKDGVLSITASAAAPGSNPYKLPYISGLATTFKSFAQTYGYFEMRAKLPAEAGLWPAFWLLPNTVVYHSELDIFEVLGKSPTVVFETTHGTASPDGSGGNIGQAVATYGINTAADFHIYGADWKPATIDFYIDGKIVKTLPTPASMNKPMYILMNMAVGTPGSWPGPPNAATVFPAAMQVDYVRVYATAATRDVQGPAAIVGMAMVTGKVFHVGGPADPSWGSSQPGVGVALVDVAGRTVANALTSASGYFQFPNVPAGTYRCVYTLPAGLTMKAGGGAFVALPGAKPFVSASVVSIP